jgi:hypothetical protein
LWLWGRAVAGAGAGSGVSGVAESTRAVHAEAVSLVAALAARMVGNNVVLARMAETVSWLLMLLRRSQ